MRRNTATHHRQPGDRRNLDSSHTRDEQRSQKIRSPRRDRRRDYSYLLSPNHRTRTPQYGHTPSHRDPEQAQGEPLRLRPRSHNEKNRNNGDTIGRRATLRPYPRDQENRSPRPNIQRGPWKTDALRLGKESLPRHRGGHLRRSKAESQTDSRIFRVRHDGKLTRPNEAYPKSGQAWGRTERRNMLALPGSGNSDSTSQRLERSTTNSPANTSRLSVTR